MIRLKTLNLPAPLWMILSVSLFSINHALVKSIASDYSAATIVFYRSLFSLALLVVFLKPTGFIESFKTQNKKLHIFRGLIGGAFLYLTVLSLRGVDLTVFTTLFYTSPLITIVISSFFLKDPWKKEATISAILCFCGVILMLRPQENIDWIYGAAALLCALCHTAITLLAKRVVQEGDTSQTLIVFYSLMTLLCTVFFADFTFYSSHGVLVMGAMGCVQLSGFYTFVKAFEKSAASLLVPYEYLSLPWALGLGALFFGESLELISLGGVFMVVIGSLVLSWTGIKQFYSQRRLRNPP